VSVVDLDEEQILMLRAIAALSLAGLSSEEMSIVTANPRVDELLDEYSSYISSAKIDILANVNDDKEMVSKVLFDQTVFAGIQFMRDIMNDGVPKGQERYRIYELVGPIPIPSRVLAAKELMKMWADMNKAGIANIGKIADGPSIPKPEINRDLTVLEEINEGKEN
jgi:hypothetical protein